MQFMQDMIRQKSCNELTVRRMDSTILGLGLTLASDHWWSHKAYDVTAYKHLITLHVVGVGEGHQPSLYPSIAIPTYL